MNPEPRTILITGAGTGIGRDAALALAARGHRVLATTLDDDQAEALQREAQSRNLVLRAFRMDITSPADRAQVLAHEVDVLIKTQPLASRARWPKSPWTVCAARSKSICFRRWNSHNWHCAA